MKRMTDAEASVAPHCTTVQAARRLGMAVRSVQMMVDRGELVAWKTPGGHRRIVRASVEACLAGRPAEGDPAAAAANAAQRVAPPVRPGRGSSKTPPRVLLIEDSVHYQKLVSLLMARRFAGVELHMADDGVAGLAMYGRLAPDILIVDILLPGIDGATLITSLRSHPQFAGSDLVVITSLDEAGRAPYAFALDGVPVVHKPRLVLDLPPLIERSLAVRASSGA